MKRAKTVVAFAGALCAYFCAMSAYADPDKVVIGDIDDMSGLYADVIGPNGVEAIKMAIADFGGSVLGQPIELLTADHQNKPDIGAQKFREWADHERPDHGARRLQHRRQPRHNAAAKEKKIPFFAIGAAGASLTGKDCTPYTVHYAYDTTALANGTAKTILNQGGKSLVLPHRRLRLRHAAAKRRGRRRQGRRRQGRRRRARAARHLGLLVLSAAGAEFGRAGARPRQRRRRLLQFAEGGQRIRHHQDDEAGGAARLPHRHQRASASRRRRASISPPAGTGTSTTRRRAFAKRFFDKTNREPTFTAGGVSIRRR